MAAEFSQFHSEGGRLTAEMGSSARHIDTVAKQQGSTGQRKLTQSVPDSPAQPSPAQTADALIP